MDVVTEKSNHNVVGMAPSPCLTPAAPAPLPIPYPVTGSSAEGVDDSPMRTKMCGVNGATIGSNIKTCHGNEPGTLKEVVSLNTAGRCPPLTGAFTVIIELGPAAITGSMANMNKGIMPGLSSSASDASGTGGGGGGGGAAPGAGGGPAGPSSPSGGGGGGGGSAGGASASPPSGKGKYCPPPGAKAPPGMQAGIDAKDLRTPGVADPSKANVDGRTALEAATQGKPGGSGQKGSQAFWSGAGKQAARDQGHSIQEDSGGAAKLEKMGQQPSMVTGPPKPGEPQPGDRDFTGRNPDWGNDSKAGAGSGVTGERLWSTISRRSAENANGSVDAFVVGEARADNIFSTVELPTLLHNPKLQQIRFRDPLDPGGAPVTWKKDKDGCWNGPDVPAGTKPPHKFVNPGFKLHPTDGFTR
jgi:hypothetical protein